MPISRDEFNKGEVRGSWEDIIIQILSDGKAYSLDELAEEIIGHKPNSKNPQEFLLYNLNELNLSMTLNSMILDGRIVSREVRDKNNKTNRYYMKK